MARAPLKFKQSDIVRALNSARAAGVDVRGFKIGADGAIEVFAQNVKTPKVAEANSWDEVYAQKTAEVLPGLR